MRYFVELMYDGTNYHGWQYQPNVISVQETIEAAISRYLRTETKVVGCGRTDSGVHASQYFLHFDHHEAIDKHFMYRLNKILPHDIAFKRVFQVEDNAHARFSAKTRSYRYQIYFDKNPFLKPFGFHYFLKELDLEKMHKMAELLPELKDFESLSKKGTDVKTTLCDIYSAKWTTEGELLVFEISANRFLRNMVRMIVGAGLMIGQRTLSLEAFESTVKAKTPFKYIMPVAPAGLFLSKVEYPFFE
ncbi:MAG: tRNA pseudouridine(38-40) synthase TruA [Chitinophagales bacterium]